MLPLGDIIATLQHHNLILVAPPGVGKTTLVPLALLDAAWLRGTILMLEPRRLATRAAAARMASLLGEPVGQRVGYRTRLDQAVSTATRIEVVTDGLLLRRLQTDPGLDGVAIVILDEIHERGLDSDLALAFCRDLQRTLRPELRLLAMSATADAARLATLLAAETIETAGRLFPVVTRHATRDLADLRDLPDTLARAVRTALDTETGDILAFLPGMGEIRRAENALHGCGALVLPLHGDLPMAEQDRALTIADTRRVVLSTSIAETSLTVPGVRVVIDGGWRRTPKLDPATGLTRLVTVRISAAAATQRAGRAGREGPGVAIRLWTTALHRSLPAFDQPEIFQAELAGMRLDCAAWGTDPAELPLPDPAPPGALAAATTLLQSLGALDATERITELGRRMARLGAHPRLAAMMLGTATPPQAALAADIAALLEERDPLRSSGQADIALRLAALRGDDPSADRAILSRIRRQATQYRRRLHLPADAIATGDPAPLLAAAFPDRIAQRRGEPGSFRLSGGGGAKLADGDPLARARLLAVAALEMKASARIRLAAPLDPDSLPPSLQAQVTESLETAIDPGSGSVLARRRRRLGALVLDDRTEQLDPARAGELLAQAVAQDMTLLPWSDAARQLQARVTRMAALEPGTWPDFSDPALAADVQDWLAPALAKAGRLPALDVAAALRTRLGYRLATRLDQALPAALDLPAGHAPVDYTQPVPVAAARAQAFFGLAATPSLADGRIPLQLALLSPAGRPIAITADIAGFWRGGWTEVRREMRGRYPRHAWPENPG